MNPRMIKVSGGGASSEWQESLSHDEWNRNLKGTSEKSKPYNRVAEINMRINIFAIVVLAAVLTSAPLANAAGASEVRPPSLPCLRFSTTTHPSYFVRNRILRPGMPHAFFGRRRRSNRNSFVLPTCSIHPFNHFKLRSASQIWTASMTPSMRWNSAPTTPQSQV
jgi:hypothetical protein